MHLSKVYYKLIIIRLFFVGDVVLNNLYVKESALVGILHFVMYTIALVCVLLHWYVYYFLGMCAIKAFIFVYLLQK